MKRLNSITIATVLFTAERRWSCKALILGAAIVFIASCAYLPFSSSDDSDCADDPSCQSEHTQAPPRLKKTKSCDVLVCKGTATRIESQKQGNCSCVRREDIDRVIHKHQRYRRFLRQRR